MEDMAQISKDISHTGSFFAETFVSFIYLTAFLGGRQRVKSKHINLYFTGTDK